MDRRLGEPHSQYGNSSKKKEIQKLPQLGIKL
jgi:hypothetical protein